MAAFYWANRFNGIERGGPFPSLEAAKADVVDAMTKVQDGFAFDLVIERDGAVIAEGHMKGGKWIDGEFSETDDERRSRRAG